MRRSVASRVMAVFCSSMALAPMTDYCINIMKSKFSSSRHEVCKPVSSRPSYDPAIRNPRGDSIMCGIVGAVSTRNIVPVLIEGLKRLEYRGYDSCGVAVHQGGELRRARSTARVAELDASVAADHVQGGTGIAHTRWATHGAPALHNAHPHFSHGPNAKTSSAGRIALVHNGISENHDELRAELQAKGYAFTSQTDTEVIAHLVHSLYRGDLAEAVRAAVKRLTGAYAIAVVARKEAHRVVGARFGSPPVGGVGEKE